MSSQKWYWLRWTLACGAGEFIGIAVAAGIAVLHFRLFGEPETILQKVSVIMVMVAAGVIEGSVTGGFQWSVLRYRFRDMKARNWLGVTALAAAVGWLLGMIPSVFFAPESSSSGTPEFSGFQIVVLSALMGIFIGALFGAFQWIELKRHTANAGRWIWANLLGWMVGLAVIFIGASIPTAETALMVTVSIGAISGLLAGLAVGAITGLFLIRLQPLTRVK